MKLHAKRANTAQRRKITLRNYCNNVFTSSVLKLDKVFFWLLVFGLSFLDGCWNLNRSAATVPRTSRSSSIKRKTRRCQEAPTFFSTTCASCVQHHECFPSITDGGTSLSQDKPQRCNCFSKNLRATAVKTLLIPLDSAASLLALRSAFLLQPKSTSE